MKNLEQNYISVVLVAENCEETILSKLSALEQVIKGFFKNYEIIVVDNMSTDNTFNVIMESNLKVNVINLPRKHGGQQALNAGISIAIGDYIVEIEDVSLKMDYKMILEMYKKCQEGYDFVFLSPKTTKFTSKLFYNVLNKYFENQLTSDITSAIMTLSSRRGQNKIAEIGSRIINRNVLYAISGLKSDVVMYDISYSNRRGFVKNLELMLDTLIYHTNVVTEFAQKLSISFFLFSLATIAYGFFAKLLMDTTPGWASTLVFINFGFSAMFLMFAVISRYSHHILQTSSDSKDYVFRSIDKK